jgi:hypothetical protein
MEDFTMKRTTILLSPQIVADLAAVSKANPDVTIARLIRRFISEGLERRKRQQAK